MHEKAEIIDHQVPSVLLERAGYGNIYDMFHKNARKYGDKPLCMYKIKKGHWGSLTFRDIEKGAADSASALLGLGIKKGDRVTFVCNNRYEWMMVDLAIQRIGAINVTNYVTPDPKKLIEKEITFNINNSGSRIAFVASKYLPKFMEIMESGKLNTIEKVIVFLDRGYNVERNDVLLFSEFLKFGSKNLKNIKEYKEKIDLDDISTLIYTSGSTGIPKGVILSHKNLLSNVENIITMIDIKDSDVELSFLPLGHVFERIINYLLLRIGGTIGYAESIETIADDVQFVKPTVFPAVPRVFEKFKKKVEENAESKGILSYRIYNWSTKVGDQYSSGKGGPLIGIKYHIAKKLVFDKVSMKLGGNVRFFVSSSAPLSEETANFFKSMNFEILEAYGMTEAGPLITINRNGRGRIGTVGEAPPEVEVRTDTDGEILVRSPSVMKGFWKRPDADREAFRDGWLATGDIGTISEDGYLKITDRKKNLIKTSNGKYVPPAPIEDKLVSNEYISQAMIIGDKRPHCSAIIIPDFKRLEDYAQKNNLHFTNYEELTGHPTIIQFYQSLLKGETSEFAHHEQPRKVILGHREWTWETGELTPTQKVRRTVINQMFQEDIEKLYT